MVSRRIDFMQLCMHSTISISLEALIHVHVFQFSPMVTGIRFSFATPDLALQQVMANPVMAANGHSYDTIVIAAWPETHHTSRVTMTLMPPPPPGRQTPWQR
ncbi:hypothetical protein ABBQ32_004847 [Trebouxia sp. C0010 RCD-2024]